MEHLVKALTIIFENDIQSREIPFFRGAINSCVDEEDILFHNHKDDQAYRYSYPLIQYKRIGGKAAVVAIDQGVKSIGNLFVSLPKELQIGKRTMEIKKFSVFPSENNIDITEEQSGYTLKSWLPLNEINYPKYNKLSSLNDKVSFLENVLCGNILSFCKGLDIFLEDHLDVEIIDIEGPYETRNKGVKILEFDVVFMANINLPDNIGLGKNSSIGYGLIKKH